MFQLENSLLEIALIILRPKGKRKREKGEKESALPIERLAMKKTKSDNQNFQN